jgi:hypothetical protein
MDATERGAFCHSCRKEVIDFSAMTDREVIEYLDKHQAGCGRFRKDQLDTKLTILKLDNGSFKWKALLLSILSITGFRSALVASIPTPVNSHINDRFLSDTTIVFSLSDSIQISGKVIDEKGEAMVGVSVFVENSKNKEKQGVATDMEGQFTLKLNRPVVEKSSHTIKISYIGYHDKAIPITNQAVQYYTINYQDKDEVVLGGMEPIIIYEHSTTAQKIRHLFRKLFGMKKY